VDGGRQFRGHIVFNLNDAQKLHPSGVPEPFGLIVFAEVLEHLYTAPELVLHVLESLLARDGIIVCQTPNAAALHKRLKLLAGINPYERIRVDSGNPGHFREYTKPELVDVARRVGLHVLEHQYADYFGAPQGVLAAAAARALEMIGKIWPAFRRGQTIVYAAAD
jgi:2-polyprenyl-3-methyl-5-hydroxy-6-metoxy-1,4-benzoquinol methylase